MSFWETRRINILKKLLKNYNICINSYLLIIKNVHFYFKRIRFIIDSTILYSYENGEYIFINELNKL